MTRTGPGEPDLPDPLPDRHPSIRPGLCSVTFRELGADEVIEIAFSAGIEGIEWGADVHAPPTAPAADLEALSARTRDAGLDVVSYGSYLFAGRADADKTAQTLDAALAIGAPNVRVWCEFGVEPSAPPAERARITSDLAEIVTAADARSLTVSLEFHPGTLTLTASSTLQLLADIGSDSLFTYWQPVPGAAAAAARREHRAVLDDRSHLHVFTWSAGGERHPLSDDDELWPAVLADATATRGRWASDRWALLEFVLDDDPEQLRHDAATLRSWLRAATPGPGPGPGPSGGHG